MKESDIQKAILNYLHLKKIIAFKHRAVGIFKQKTGSFIPLPENERGISDILGVIPPSGRFLAIEVKMKYNKPSEYQQRFLDQINKAGGIALVAYSLDDVMKIL